MKRGIWLLVVAAAATAAACGSDSGDSEKSTGGAAGASSGGTSSGGSGNASGAGGSTSGGGSAGQSPDGGGSGGTSSGGSGGTSADAANDVIASDAGPAAQCFISQFVNPPSVSLDYDQFGPTVGTHCKGTNHQDIKGIERVVFLGDSVTVGTPPSNLNPANVYRAILAQMLAAHLKIAAPGFGWGGADPINGVALPSESGAFVSCAKWGARTDDLMKDSAQVETCIPPNKRHLRHLVIMTIGGNDISAITQDGGGTAPKKTIPELWQDTKDFVDLLRQTVVWLKNPANVPGGVDVVFGNNYEFTDGTGEVTACPGVQLGGIQPWQDKKAQADMVIWANEQYMKIAVDTKSDMIFMLESFCGHGYKRNDPTGPCYRGPNQPLWFDLTCIHPSNEGHVALADLFFKTIVE
ncbi:MAG: SGNH/GDSL hydrolase family protein [Myxococcales bacterium]|nr:SGNH/GDSL hydrolase family protein [Myxococcales bacterium]